MEYAVLADETNKRLPNKLRGARSKAMGDAWEVMLSNACDAYRKAGIADIQKTPEPFRVTRNLGKGRFEGHFIHCAQPDYKGIMMNGQGIILKQNIQIMIESCKML